MAPEGGWKSWEGRVEATRGALQEVDGRGGVDAARETLRALLSGMEGLLHASAANREKIEGEPAAGDGATAGDGAAAGTVDMAGMHEYLEDEDEDDARNKHPVLWFSRKERDTWAQDLAAANVRAPSPARPPPRRNPPRLAPRPREATEASSPLPLPVPLLRPSLHTPRLRPSQPPPQTFSRVVYCAGCLVYGAKVMSGKVLEQERQAKKRRRQ